MKTSIKDLSQYLTEKKAGSYYIYVIDSIQYSINEYNNNKGWCLNESSIYNGKWVLVSSYGYEGLTLRECKEMILMSVNAKTKKA